MLHATVNHEVAVVRFAQSRQNVVLHIVRHLHTVFVMFLALCLTENLGFDIDSGLEVNLITIDVQVLALNHGAFADALLLGFTLALQSSDAEDIRLDASGTRVLRPVHVNADEEVTFCLASHA